MPDYRTTPLRDDFERANETPIQPPWIALTGFGIVAPRIVSGRFAPNNSSSNKTSAAYWSTQAFDVSNIEIWGTVQGSADISEGVRLGWLREIGPSTFDGHLWWINNSLGANRWQIQRLTNGGSTSILNETGFVDIGTDDRFLFRREGDDLVGYFCNGPTFDNLTEMQRVTDTTYNSGNNFYLTLIIDHDDASDPNWEYVGGGEQHQNRTQFYRWIKN